MDKLQPILVEGVGDSLDASNITPRIAPNGAILAARSLPGGANVHLTAENGSQPLEIALLDHIIAPSSREILEYLTIAPMAQWIVDGETLHTIAQRVGVPPSVLCVWLNAPPNLAQYKEARRLSAAILQDEALQIVDACDGLTHAGVALAKLRSDQRMRVAGLRDRTQHERYTPPTELPQNNTTLKGSISFVVSAANPPSRTIDNITQAIEGDA